MYLLLIRIEQTSLIAARSSIFFIEVEYFKSAYFFDDTRHAIVTWYATERGKGRSIPLSF